MVSKVLVSITVFLSAAAVLFAPTSANSQDKSEVKGLYKIRYHNEPANLNNSGLVYLDVAHELGFDKEAGIELANIGAGGNGGPANIQIMMNNESDVVYTHATAAINAIKIGLKLRIIASLDGGKSYDENNKLKPASGITSLRKSNIKTAADLAGKKIYVNTLGAAQHYQTKYWLRKAGVPENSVSFIVLPKSIIVQALHQGQVDAIWNVTEVTRLKQLGDDPVVIDSLNIAGDHSNSGYAVRQDFIDKHPDIARKLTEVTVRVYDWKKKNLKKFKELTAKIGARDGLKISTDDFVWSSRLHALTDDKDIAFWINELVIDKKLKPGQIKPSDVYTNEFNPFNKK